MKYIYYPFLAGLLFGCSDHSTSNQEKQTSTHIPAVEKGDLSSFSFGNIFFEVDGAKGGRISSLKLDNKELLYTSRDNNNNNWGSTFWPSPQQLWGWPPPDTLDSSPYENITTGDTIFMKSKLARLPKVIVSKEFLAIAEDSSILINYTIYNQGDSALKVSPWEITRVPSGGHVFFPKGKDEPRGELAVLTKDSSGVVWFDYDSTEIPKGVPKLFSDGSEGWIAYLNNDRQILIKKFEDAPLESKAPDPENEIEIYTHPDNHYIEVEEQGPYASIPAGKSYAWKVKWYPRQVPASVNIQTGNKELLQFIREVIK